MLQYLVQVKQYPAPLIAVEKEIMVGELKKRFDILIYRNDQPWMMIECKEMKVKLNEEVLLQVLRYNISVPVNFILVTNGSQTFGWTKQAGELVQLEEIPVL